MSFLCLRISQKTNEIFSRISALASKKRSNKKKQCKRVKIKSSNQGYKAPIFFNLTSFKRLGQIFLQKFRWFLGRFEDTKRTFRNYLTFRIRMMLISWSYLLEKKQMKYKVSTLLHHMISMSLKINLRVMMKWYLLIMMKCQLGMEILSFVKQYNLI